MDLTSDFKEFVELLNKHNVRYLIVGGYAVAVYGHPRYTKDLDIWVEPAPDNSNGIVAALTDFGFGSVNLTQDDFLKPGWVIQLGNPPNRIDLPTSVSSLEFEEAFAHRNVVDVMDLPVAFVSLKDLNVETIEGLPVLRLSRLIEIKIAFGAENVRRMHKDFADVVELIAILKLDGTFAKNLHKSVRDVYRKLVRNARGEL